MNALFQPLLGSKINGKHRKRRRQRLHADRLIVDSLASFVHDEVMISDSARWLQHFGPREQLPPATSSLLCWRGPGLIPISPPATMQRWVRP